MVLGQSYWFTWIVPKSPVVLKNLILDEPVALQGWILLLVLSFIIMGLVIIINVLNKRKLTDGKSEFVDQNFL